MSISCDGLIGVTILDITDIGSDREPTVQINPENLQAPLYVSERNNVHIDPPSRKTPPINGIVIARGAAFVSANEVDCYSEDSRGSLINHIGKPGSILLPPASKSYGLPSFPCMQPRQREKERKDGANTSSVTMRSVCLIKVLGNRPVNALCVILEIMLVLQAYSTDLILEPISFFDIGQMLPLKVLSQVSWTSKLENTLFERQALFP